MLILDRDWNCDAPSLQLRNPSQIKIRYPMDKPIDTSHLTIDLLRFAQVKTPGRLSAEVIINLVHNGVPAQLFVDLCKQALADTALSLTTWEGEDAMYNLWRSVEKSEHVLSARRGRESVTDGRLKGFIDPKEDDLKDDENADRDTSGQRSTAWWPDPISGCPSSMAETVMALLAAGFTPQNCPILMDKLKQITKCDITNLANKFRFENEQTATAFAVPGALFFQSLVCVM
jgi:RNA-dependent RNA polymerase